LAEPLDPRVAVYIDFDNIVISRYSQVHGRNQARLRDADLSDTHVQKRLSDATVDIGAILDFATSFGNVAISRAYADWSVPVNASYQKQLIGRAVDLTQMFPTVASMKNGADIRLAVDVIEDLFRLPDITHVVIVAGDSDYIALAQRCKRLGRHVVGVGVAGSTSTSLADACDEFKGYDDLPGLHDEADDLEDALVAPTAEPPQPRTPSPRVGPQLRAAPSQPPSSSSSSSGSATAPNKEKAATQLFMRALRLAHDKDDDAEWLQSTLVKNQMLRINPSFSEKALGYSSFSAFVKSRNSIAELRENGLERHIRLRPSYRKE
jgi:uncharacterized LabA/DUF88 family protein